MRRDRVVRGLIRLRFLITMDDGTAWDGVLVEADEKTLEIREAEHLTADGRRTKADGFIYLPRDSVAYMQRVP